MGGSSTPSKTSQTVTTSNIPAYAKPYFTDVLNRAKGLAGQDYVPYEDQRVADFTPEQRALQEQLYGMQAPSQFGQATEMAQQAGQYTPADFTTQAVTPDQLQYFQLNAPETFGAAQAQQYMSPYMQEVVDIQKRSALQDAKQAQLLQNLGAARTGTYGGARQLLAGTQRESALARQLGDIQAQGLQAAYENAQQQFERDRAAQLGISQENLRAALGIQELGSGQSLQAALANQEAQMEAQKLAEQSRQFGSSQGLAGAELLGRLGAEQQASELGLLDAQQKTAAQEQALQQQGLDIAYADFLRERDYPLEMLSYYSNILRGLDVKPSSTATTYAPSISPLERLASQGLGAASVYKLATG